MVVLEFWLGSYGMSLMPSFFIFFRTDSTLWDLPGDVIFFQNYLYIWRYKGLEGKNEIGTTREKNIFDFFSNWNFFLSSTSGF